MQITIVEPGNVDQAAAVAQEAAAVLADGGLVVFPTETVYGVGASIRSETGVSKLRQAKGGQANQTYTMHLASPQDAAKYADLSDLRLSRLIDKLLAGPVTVRLAVDEQTIGEKLSELGLAAEDRDRVYADRTVALRCPNHEITNRILATTDQPAVAGSASTVNQPAPHDAQTAVAQLHVEADYVVDGGHTRYAKGSTLVDVRIDQAGWPVVQVRREGVYDERTIRRLARFTVLSVCSGNTCRSPMAEALARHMLARRRGLSPDELDAAGIRVISAGVSAVRGVRASVEGDRAMQERGLDLTDHRSTPLTRELVDESDLILAMTDTHLAAINALAPEASHRTLRLDPDNDIADPMSHESSEVYEQTARQIEHALDHRFTELGL